MNDGKASWLSSCIHFLNIQLFLSLISLPILIAWGLPLSLLSPIGNLIFSPILSAFLLISSFIFFTELLYIPNDWLLRVLELITAIWQWILKVCTPTCYIGFKKPHWLLLILIPLCTIAFLFIPLLFHPLRRFTGLLVLFLLSWGILKINISQTSIVSLDTKRGRTYLIESPSKIFVIDKGGIAPGTSSARNIAYTFLPQLIKKTGKVHIDYLIITKPSLWLFDALNALLDHITITKIIMPYVPKEMDATLKRTFNRFYAHAKQNNVQLTTISSKSTTIHEGNVEITTSPGTPITYRALSIKPLKISGFIDNTPLTFYDSPKPTEQKRG